MSHRVCLPYRRDLPCCEYHLRKDGTNEERQEWNERDLVTPVLRGNSMTVCGECVRTSRTVRLVDVREKAGSLYGFAGRIQLGCRRVSRGDLEARETRTKEPSLVNNWSVSVLRKGKEISRD